MTKVSFVKNMVNVAGDFSIDEVFNMVNNGRYKDEVTAIRNCYASNNSGAADELKKKLAGITFSGLFDGRREAKQLKEYSQMVVLDLDNVEPQRVKQLKEIAKAMDTTLLAFVSPSGYGLKIVVKVNTQLIHHGEAYKQVLKAYCDELGEKFDESGKDVARLTFISYDPDAYYQPCSKIFDVAIQIGASVSSKVKAISHQSNEQDFDAAWEHAVSYTSKKVTFQVGKRNNYLFLLARNANRYGLSIDYLKQKCMAAYAAVDFTEGEIVNTIKSAYRNVAEFKTWKLPVKRPQPSEGAMELPVTNQLELIKSKGVSGTSQCAGGELVKQHFFKFELSKAQLSHLQNMIDNFLQELNISNGKKKEFFEKKINGAVFKISRLLTTFERIGRGDYSAELICGDREFILATVISSCLFEHAAICAELFRRDTNNTITGRMKSFYQGLPDEFDRQIAIAKAKELNMKISSRTVDNYLNRYVECGLVEHNHDSYKKAKAMEGNKLDLAA